MYVLEEKIELIWTINFLREEMIYIGLKEGLTSRNTLTISQKLDQYIARYQSIHLNEIMN